MPKGCLFRGKYWYKLWEMCLKKVWYKQEKEIKIFKCLTLEKGLTYSLNLNWDSIDKVTKSTYALKWFTFSNERGKMKCARGTNCNHQSIWNKRSSWHLRNTWKQSRLGFKVYLPTSLQYRMHLFSMKEQINKFLTWNWESKGQLLNYLPVQYTPSYPPFLLCKGCLCYNFY